MQGYRALPMRMSALGRSGSVGAGGGVPGGGCSGGWDG